MLNIQWSLTITKLAHLFVLLLQLLADLLRRHAPGQWLGHFAQDSGGRVLRAAQVVAESVLFQFEVLAETLEAFFDQTWVAALFFRQGLFKPVEHGDANWKEIRK